MIRKAILVAALALCPMLVFAAQDVATAVDGTVKKIDSGTKTVVVDASDGTEHTFYSGDLVVHGSKDAAKDTAKGTDDAFHGVKEGSKVAVHYTADGGKETAHEIDNIGDDGLKATKGTITHIDRGTKTVAVNLQERAGEWRLLGTFDNPRYVELNNAADGIVVADAVRFERVGW